METQMMEMQRLEKKIKALEEKQKELEIALQEAERGNKYKELQTALEAVDDVLGNITALDNVTSERELDRMMPELLASLGKYSMSERAYLFAWTSEERQVLGMTHEWCTEGVEPTIDKMQELNLKDLPNWAPRLNRGEAIVSMDWNEEGKATPQEYQVFDGLEATKRIRSLERRDAGRIPIFAMTANAFAEDVEQSKAAGMDEHLSKPLEEEKMLQVIKRYMAGRFRIFKDNANNNNNK